MLDLIFQQPLLAKCVCVQVSTRHSGESRCGATFWRFPMVWPISENAKVFCSTSPKAHLTWECHTRFQVCSRNQDEGIGAGLARSGSSRQPPLPKHPKQGQMEGVGGAMISKQGLLEGARGEVLMDLWKTIQQKVQKAVCPAQNQNLTFLVAGKYFSVTSWSLTDIFQWLQVLQKSFLSDLRSLKNRFWSLKNRRRHSGESRCGSCWKSGRTE